MLIRMLSAAVWLFLIAGSVRAEARYTITDLGTPGPAASVTLFGLNSRGDVAGFNSFLGSGTPIHRSFLLRGGVSIELTGPQGEPATVVGINESGTVAGTYGGDGNLSGRALTWSPSGVPNPLPLPEGASASGARAIGASGIVVGYVRDDTGMDQAIAWSPSGVPHTLTAPAGYYLWAAVAIDDEDTIYAEGLADIDGDGELEDGLRTVRWVGEAFEDLGEDCLVGGVGRPGTFLCFAAGENGPKMTLVQGESRVDLAPLPEAEWAVARDVNYVGQAVGFSFRFNPFGHSSTATLWENGEAVDLNSLIDPSEGWWLGSATAINDAGLIAAVGGRSGLEHALLLTPVPEASSIAMVATGLALVGIVRVRARRRA